MMRPGGTQFTVMPCLPTSRDSPFAHECTAALAAKAPFSPSGSDLPVMLMMRPHLRSTICGRRRWVSWRWRVKLRVSASSHCASLVSSVNRRLPPALFTRMSTRPSAASAASAMRCGASGKRKSCSMIASLPASFCSSSSRLRRRATTASLTPSFARQRAIARPMPMLAPVTSAHLPAMARSKNFVPLSLELEDVHPGIGPVDCVDVAAVVHLEVVGLDRDLAALVAGGVLDAAPVGLVGGRRDVVAGLARMVGVGDVDRAHAGVEPGDEDHFLRVHRRLVLVGGMRAEAAAARAEVARAFRDVEGGDADRHFLVGDVDDEHPLARLEALVDQRLVHHEDEVARRALVVREFRQAHAEHRERGVRPVHGREREAPDLGRRQVLRRGLVRPGEQLRAVDNLHDAGLVRAVSEIDAIALRTRGDRPMQLGRHGLRLRAGLLAGEAEIADEPGIRRVGEVVHLRHAPRAPAIQPGDEVGDARVAFPPALVRALELVHHDSDSRRLFRRGHVPDLVREVAERAQQVDLALISLGELGAVAHSHHLRAAGLALPRLARDVGQVARLARVGHVDDRGAAVLFAATQRAHALGAGTVLRPGAAETQAENCRESQLPHAPPPVVARRRPSYPKPGMQLAGKGPLAMPEEPYFTLWRTEMIKTLIAVAVAGAFALPVAALASADSDNIVVAQAGGGDAITSAMSGTGASNARMGFDRLDRNRDGFISRDEARDANELKTRFSELDKDNDGKLSREEYDALDMGARGARGSAGATSGTGSMSGSASAPAGKGPGAQDSASRPMGGGGSDAGTGGASK